MNQKHAIEIGLIVYEKAQMAAILGLTDLLMVASKIAAKHQDTTDLPLQVSHWEIKGSNLRPTCNFSSNPDGSGRLAAIIIPPTLEWLRDQHSTGVILSSVCAGAFLLGETGLLSKRKATTHWGYVEEFEQRFPDVDLDVDRIIIEDGDIVTAGGAMAWTDLGLRMVDRFLGSQATNEAARALLSHP